MWGMFNLFPPRKMNFTDLSYRNYAYVAGHPMKPHRIRMTHSLIMNYGLYKKMEIYVRCWNEALLISISLTMVTSKASKACHETRDVSISH